MMNLDVWNVFPKKVFLLCDTKEVHGVQSGHWHEDYGFQQPPTWSKMV